MAVLTYIIKNTNQETVIKVDAVANASGTVTLTDLTASTQALTVGGTPKVNIVKAIFTGELGSAIRITRNGENILACAPENAPVLDLNSNGITENRQNDKNIVIIKEGTDNVPVTGYLVLRKVDGWSTKVETAQFGIYDDQSVVGS
jgi:hypothetical protein